MHREGETHLSAAGHPAKMEVVAGEVFKYPILVDVQPRGSQINVVDIFMSLDANLFEAVDTDGSTAGHSRSHRVEWFLRRTYNKAPS